jgi:hypothetical protein
MCPTFTLILYCILNITYICKTVNAKPYQMRTLLLVMAGALLSLTTKSQDVVELRPDLTLKDSIVYKNSTSILVINRVDLQNFMLGLDSTLKKTCYESKIFRNAQFARLTPQDVEDHFTTAMEYLSDSTHTEYNFTSDKVTLFWTQGEGMLLPYVEDMLTDLLTDGRIKVIDRSTQKSVPQYTIHYEDIAGRPYKIYKLPSGRIIFKESNFFLEQFAQSRN